MASIARKVCSLTEPYAIHAIGQNSLLTEDGVKSILTLGINESLNQDDISARQSQIDADNAPLSISKIRTQTLTRMWLNTGNSRFQIRTFNARIQQLLLAGYALPAGYDAEYMECLGKRRAHAYLDRNMKG
jgi:hypothetical protein